MAKMVCTICGWVYDPEQGGPAKGVKPGTGFDRLPPDFRCPKCGAAKKWFKEMQ
ncbi:MAG: rubredoxin [Methanobacteriota archaeon]